MALLVGRLERDLQAVLPRRSISAYGTPVAALSSSVDATTSGLALTRSGNALLESTLSAPQRVAWRIVDGRIERLAWNGADAAPREEPRAVAILAPASGLAFRFLDAKSGEWRSGWSLPGSDEGLPAAVEATVTLASGERVVRLIDLPRAP